MSTPVLLTLTHKIVAKGDSAATSQYWWSQDSEQLSDIRPYSDSLVVLLDADTIQPTQQGILSLSKKLKTSSNSHNFTSIKNFFTHIFGTTM